MPAPTELLGREPTQDTFMWQPVIDGLAHDVPITVVRHPDALVEGDQQLHFYPGLGEELRATPKGIHTLGEKGLAGVGVILPFHYLPAEARNVERTIVEVPHAIAEEYNGLAGNPVDMPVDVIGHSQGGGAVIKTASEAPEKFGAIAAWAPVALTSEAFGNTPEGKRHQFIWRLGVLNVLKREQSMFLDVGNFAAMSETLGRVISDVRARRLSTKLDYALSLDLTGDVKGLSGDHDLAVFAGDTDPLFRVAEYQDSLRGIGAEDLLVVIPGSHATINNRGGRRQLGIVADWMVGVRKRR